MRSVKVKRDRASAPAIAVAFMLTAAMFYGVTIGAQNDRTAEKAVYTDRQEEVITLSGGQWWCVHLGAFENADEARIGCARYMQRGAAGYAHEKDGVIYALGNLYDDEEAARKMSKSIEGQGIESGVFRVHAPDVKIRITAEKSAADALHGAYKLVVNAENTLLDIARRLDAGAIGMKDARVLLSVLRYDHGAHIGMAQRHKSDRGAAGRIFRLYAEMDAWMEGAQKETGGEMYLSARLKYIAMEARFRRIILLNDL